MRSGEDSCEQRQLLLRRARRCPLTGRRVELVTARALALVRCEEMILFAADEVNDVHHPGEGRRPRRFLVVTDQTLGGNARENVAGRRMLSFQRESFGGSGLHFRKKLRIHRLTPLLQHGAEAGIHFYVGVIDVTVDAAIGIRINSIDAGDLSRGRCSLIGLSAGRHADKQKREQHCEAERYKLPAHELLPVILTPSSIQSGKISSNVSREHQGKAQNPGKNPRHLSVGVLAAP